MSALVLRDIHQVPAPPWWPPAPGWWLVGAVVVGIVGFMVARALRRRRGRRLTARLFDDTLARAAARNEQVAAMSELLRRAGRRLSPGADRLEGEAWLAMLDGDDRSRPFTRGDGRLVLDGAFRPVVDASEVDALRVLARRRFLQWMERP